MFLHRLHLPSALPCLAAAFTSAASLAAAAAPDFQREVRPILSNHCFQCHGPDEEGRKGGLRLDVRDDALKPAKSGEKAIVPGQVDASALVARILSTDEDELMPPPHAKKPMTEAQKEVLKRWVAAGAEYTKHWAFTPPQMPAIPQVPEARVHNPVDAFVAARLHAAGLKQAPPADPATLARRVALDLTGLPPTEEQLTAFLQDPAPAAYERLVDALLKSPRYGERWARRWLDLARYADTNGYEKDRARSIWPWREWVIRALNEDMPFDRFTVEQLAGDMLPGATTSQKIATGFHRNTMLNEEGGIDPLEFRFHAMADRVATTGATWLGLTLGCAQCHTHKYDPVTHTEYYGLMAFLNNADEPDMDLPDPQAAAQQEASRKRAAALLADLPSLWPVPEGGQATPMQRRELAQKAFQTWLETQRKTAVAWQVLKPVKATSNLPLLTIQPGGVVLASGDITKSDAYELELPPSEATVTALRLEALPHDSLPAHGPGLCYYEGPKGDFFMGEFQIQVNGKPAAVVEATESYAKNNFGKNPATAAMAVDGDPQTGWSCAGRPGERHEAVFRLAEPAPAGARITVRMLFGRHYACSLGCFRISGTAETQQVKAGGLEENLAALLRQDPAALTPLARQALFEHFLLAAPELEKEARKINALRKPAQATTTLVMRERPEGQPRPTHRHHRGEFTQPKEEVRPVTLSVLHPFTSDLPRNRLGFARWLVSPQNPLTPRVVVNRAWAAFFGRGLVKTVDDFGYQGASPSHPELLDWLALEFVRQGGSFKKLHKLIVMSATYQQQAVKDPAQAGVDPENILLSHFPRTRLDAEIIRDGMLQASGLLVEKIGGPSVYPPQPDSVTEAAYGNFKWTPSTGPDRYRRSLYTFSKRTAPFALFTTFDGPTGEACLVKREVSNTPLQALTALNDIIVVEASRALGGRIAAVAGGEEARIRALFQQVLCRPPSADETTLLRGFIEQQRRRLTTNELNAAEVTGGKAGDPGLMDSALWTLAARALFNLDEFLTKG